MVGIATLPILSGDTELSNHSGSFFLGYRRNLSEKLEVGGVFGYEQASSDKLQNAGKSFTAKQHNFALMADVRYNYIAQHRFRLYSGASLGLAIQRNTVDGTEDNTSKSVTQEAFHIDAIGLSYGHRIAPFINLGYGYKGIINLGIQTRF